MRAKIWTLLVFVALAIALAYGTLVWYWQRHFEIRLSSRSEQDHAKEVVRLGSLFPQSQEGIELDVMVTKVERIKRDSVRVDIKIVNRAHATVFLPRMGGEPPKIHSLEIERFEPKRAWVLLPLGTELPAFHAIEIKAGETYEDILYLRDPISIRYPRQEIPLYGKYRIRVGYFSSETDWKAYLAQGAALAQLPPEKFSPKGLLAPKNAYSKAFEIPKVSSQR